METKFSQQESLESSEDNKELFSIVKIENTPFSHVIYNYEDKHLLTIGKNVLMESDNEYDIRNAVNNKDWELIEKLIIIYFQNLSGMDIEGFIKLLKEKGNE